MDKLRKGLVVDPSDCIRFVGDTKKDIRSSFTITNKTDQKIAYKIKCTKNDSFKISSSMDLLPPGQSRAITITYRATSDEVDNRHHIGVYHIPAPEGCTAPSAWGEHYGPPVGEHRLRIVMENE